MAKKVYYERVGRKYLPVREYDSDLMESFPAGTHMVVCYPGGRSYRYNIDPALAPMIAAGRLAEDAMCKAMAQASELRPPAAPLTPGQKAAWQQLAQEFGSDLCTLHGASTHDIVEAGVLAMQEAASQILSDPRVLEAYERFLLIAGLTREH